LPFLIWGGMGWASVTPQLCSLTQIEPDREAILVALNSSAVSLGGAVGTALGGLALSGGLGVAKLPYITAAFVLCALASQIHLLREAGPVEAAP
jgi:predicted MFS family arabinose efflux permease